MRHLSQAASVQASWFCHYFFTSIVLKYSILVFQASALMAYLALILLSDLLVLAHILLHEWSVLTSVPLSELVGPCSVLPYVSYFLECYILVFQAFAPSVCLAVYSFWSTRVLAHILLHEGSVLTSFPMWYLPQDGYQTNPKKISQQKQIQDQKTPMLISTSELVGCFGQIHTGMSMVVRINGIFHPFIGIGCKSLK